MFRIMDTFKVELKEFLNFLSLACKISVKENCEEMKNIEVDLNELATNTLITQVFDHILTIKKLEIESSSLVGKSLTSARNEFLGDMKMETSYLNAGILEIENLNCLIGIFKQKLFELLNEGIFDSILSYLIPINFTSSDIKPVQFENKTNRNKKERRKKCDDTKTIAKHETEVEIHVYDEVKGFKRDFKCTQSLLTTHMGYFSEITKGQKLEEMDISVHCDITIFEWLMKWMKASCCSNTLENQPKLDHKNVVPIMVSANFLQMKPLFQDCLHYCKANLNEVIRFWSNLTCLSDHILKKLADKLTNTEVQQLKDRKDKIKSRLFCKLIMSLNEEEPEKHRGHYASLAYLYICLNCGKLVTRVSAPYVPCQVQYITIKCNGDVMFNHSRDPKWNINEYIKCIWAEYKSWSNTYWRLWSQCHFLYCYMCCTMYAVAFADCCPYHPQQPHFYPLEQFQSTNSPIGRYPCCGSKAIRYETIVMPSGCKLRSHIPKLQTNDDTCIQTIINSFPDLIKLKRTEDNMTPFAQNYDLANFDGLFKNTFICKEDWGINQGLLKGPLFESCMKNIKKYKSVGGWEPYIGLNICNSEKDCQNIDCCSIGESETSDTSFIHDLSISDIKQNDEIVPSVENIQLRPNRNEIKPIWSSRYSVRHNQDNQRDYEEIFFQAMSEILLQKNFVDKQGNVKNIAGKINYPLGGTYAKIESEWKEMLRTKSFMNKSKSSYS